MVKHFMSWLATAATLSFTVPAGASQTDPRLDALFLQLRAAGDVAEARMIEQEIWQIWLISDNDAVNRLMARGLRAVSAGNPAAALEFFDDIVKVAPDFAEGWNKRATVHYLLGNYADSVSDIERTLKLEPRHFGALSGLGLVNLALGNEKQALTAFEAALQVYPLMPGANSHIKELRDKIKGRET